MYQAMSKSSLATYNAYIQPRTSHAINCDWRMLREQLLEQWRKITAGELDNAGPDRAGIANLIERKYGISSRLAENYLRNFERTMPLSGNA